jgi:predicted homoserine dehydrogenase-like protein
MNIKDLYNLKDPIKIGLIGTGFCGKAIFYQIHNTPNMKCVAISDLIVERCIECATLCNIKYQIVDTLPQLERAVEKNELAICQDGNLIAQYEEIDTLVESSSSIFTAAEFIKTAITHNTDVVLMNSEVDLAFGPELMDLAHKNNVVYTSCDGDQHTVVKQMVDEILLWGFDIVMVGNIKGFLDRHTNPTKIIPEADKRNLDHKMCSAYTDGTKLCIENALMANSMNLRVVQPGMLGPRLDHITNIFDVFEFDSIWDGRAIADYVLGAEPGGGVFVIGYLQSQGYQKDMLKYLKMGGGPYYLFYRPYHLVHLETTTCILKVFLNKKSLLEPTYGYKANVYCYAKKDLKKGDVLDGIGGYTCYGLIENTPNHGFPIAISEGKTLKSNIAKDQKINITDVF